MADDGAIETIKAALGDARRCREQHDERGREAYLEAAQRLAVEHAHAELLTISSWRLAKARFDASRSGIDRALEPLLAHQHEQRGLWGIKHRVTPFTHYPTGLAALARLTSAHRDREGYGSAILDHLWTEAIQLHEAQGEHYLAWRGRQVRAWKHACRGELAPLHELWLASQRLKPRDLRESPHRHPSAPDAPSSVFWIQQDLARTYLRALTWGDASGSLERNAWQVHEALEEAMEDTRTQRSADVWYLEATLHAAWRFGWTTQQPALASSLRQMLDQVPSNSHRLRMTALLQHVGGESSNAAFAESAEYAKTEQPGPEWQVLALVGAGEPHVASQVGHTMTVKISANAY